LSDDLEPSKGRRLYLVLRDRILRGEIAPLAPLPGEPRLAAEFSVSRVTVRRALDQLVRDGLVQRRPGAGTFVREKPLAEPAVADLADVFAYLQAMGASTTVRLLSCVYGAPPAGVAAAIRLPCGSVTQRSERVRLIDGQPFCFLTAHVPEPIARTYTEADLVSTPLLVLLERAGLTIARASQTITAVLAGPTVAEALAVDVGAPLLALTRSVFDATGAGIEHLHALYRPDRYTFATELHREGSGDTRRWTAATLAPPAGEATLGDPSRKAKQSVRSE